MREQPVVSSVLLLLAINILPHSTLSHRGVLAHAIALLLVPSCGRVDLAHNPATTGDL